MSEWSEKEGEPAPRDWEDLMKKALIGVGGTVAVLAWMLFARPGEEPPSSRGFNLASGGASVRPFTRRTPKTSLDMVSADIGAGPPGVTSGIFRPGGSASSEKAAETVESVAASQPLVSRPPPPAAPAPAGDAAAMSAIPTDAKRLNRLGAEKGLLSSLAEKMLDHPNVLKAIFNNKLVVNAFMNREISKRNCQSGGALKSYLSDPKSGGMSKVFPVIQAALSRPETASALAGTEMAQRVFACPSIEALAKDPTAIVSVAMSNSKALGVLSDPRMVAALAANPRASGVLAGMQAKMGGAP